MGETNVHTWEFPQSGSKAKDGEREKKERAPDEFDPGRGQGGYEEYQPFLVEEDGPPPYNPTIEWK